ncbi:alpha/beta hydrolase fold domain-containing protein [Paenarthrobacter sp. YAF11_1]|uniref:alpha/beta hydrolase fold domain-containing protein n=1 Tax=Paenarthrobacter sp. YAF11_1 TaxID=3233074 RepID=UPI003F99AF32
MVDVAIRSNLDVEFAPGLMIDVVRPDTAEVLPAVIWLHGGGWRMQDRKARPDFAQYFAKDSFVMVSADYGLAPATRWPGQLLDVRKVIRFVREHAAEYGINPEAIALFGSSSGGHLAAMAGLTSHRALLPDEEPSEISPSVQAVVNGYGAADLLALAKDAPPWKSGNSPEVDLLGGPVLERIHEARSASPALNVGSVAPPFLILHGQEDHLMPAAQSHLLYNALADSGFDVVLYEIAGFGHGFLNPGPVQELGPDHVLDTGRLEAEPSARAETQATTPEGKAFLERFPSASFSAISAYLTGHLSQVSTN